MTHARKVLSLFLIGLIAFGTLSVNAQSAPVERVGIEPLAWIPADFVAYVRVDMSDLTTANLTLNLGMYTAAVLQPNRSSFTAMLGFDSFFPLINLLDVEDASFERDILPWMGDEIILAYRNLDTEFIANTNQVLLLLPISDKLQAASYLRRIIDEQDLLEQETYRDQTIYLGDQASFVFTPEAVLIGDGALVQAALDIRAGDGEALASSELHALVSATLGKSEEPPVLTAYLNQDAAQTALAFLLGAGETGTPILQAMGGAFSQTGNTRSAESLLLAGDLDALGIEISANLNQLTLFSHITAHLKTAPTGQGRELDPAILELIPRNAVMVQSGGNAGDALRTGLTALPLINFAGAALAAFPIQASGAALSATVPTPTAADIDSAIGSFTEAIQPVVDLNADVLDNFTGSYALAILPRPNNPLELLDSPVDILLIAQTDTAEDATATADHLSSLVEAFSSTLDEVSIEDNTFFSLKTARSDEAIISIGAVDNLVVMGTGDTPRSALAAMRGDNRLIDQTRWQGVAGDTPLTTYVDAGALINLFFPLEGGSADMVIRQIGISSHMTSSDLLEMDAVVLLSQ